ncbi:uncharacterized protein LOC135839216 [Planococcus citri]|uniref:uncharacterized protein LOC135839216 n=1 Tax=Planococcus citri TaxID=170843 RepID=UPI0031FA19DA
MKWICAIGIVLIIANAVFGVCIDDEPDIFQCRRLKPGVTESDNECRNIIKTRDYKYEHFFPISKRDNGNIELTFRVKGDRDANLLFSSNVFPQDGDPAHEIIFSAATSGLRIAKNNETGRVDTSSDEARVSPNEWREFWVKINGKTVQVGRKEKEASLVSSNSIDVPIKYYSVAGHKNANVLWSFPCIEEKDFS